MLKNFLLNIIYILSSIFYLFLNYFFLNNRISVICYHKTSPDTNSQNNYWNVSPNNFREQMEYLNQQGYITLHTHEIPDILKKNTWNEKYICITFDDGYNDNYKYAYQILKELDLKANFYISTNYIDNNSPFPFLKKNKSTDVSSIIPIKKKQLIEMSNNNISIQSHGHIHQSQSQMTEEDILDDIKKSLIYLKDFHEENLINLSYVSPFGISGKTEGKVKSVLKKLNIKLAFLGKWGSVTSNSELIDMKRVPIYGRDSLNEFKLKIKGAYDWVGILHTFYKDNIRS